VQPPVFAAAGLQVRAARWPLCSLAEESLRQLLLRGLAFSWGPGEGRVSHPNLKIMTGQVVRCEAWSVSWTFDRFL
jgi:hypothetical protein